MEAIRMVVLAAVAAVITAQAATVVQTVPTEARAITVWHVAQVKELLLANLAKAAPPYTLAVAVVLPTMRRTMKLRVKVALAAAVKDIARTVEAPVVLPILAAVGAVAMVQAAAALSSSAMHDKGANT